VCYHIPKASLKKIENRIADGDLIAVTTLTEGLDVTHVGIAVRVRHRIHFLHASSLAGSVIISTETLDRYLAGSKDRSGIMVARAVESVKRDL